MAGFSPKLPLAYDSTDGFYLLNKTFKEFVSQNLKMLILTAPGERMMDPFFGVGLRNFLFENTPHDEIGQEVHTQVQRYMPFINIGEINFTNNIDPLTPADKHTLEMEIVYEIVPINLVDVLKITDIQN